MKIEIEIPKEFEEHFKQDSFKDSLQRLSADAHLVAGNYEKETVEMLIKAFQESKPIYDVDDQNNEMPDGFCEWKMDCVGASIGCRSDLHHTGYVNDKICPFCGKRIKVVE